MGLRVRFSSRHFLYAVRHNLTLPRNFIIAENHRRFWRGIGAQWKREHAGL